MEVVYVDETNLGGAIDVIDLDSMAQHIYFGPQAEILQKLNQFTNDSLAISRINYMYIFMFQILVSSVRQERLI